MFSVNHLAPAKEAIIAVEYQAKSIIHRTSLFPHQHLSDCSKAATSLKRRTVFVNISGDPQELVVFRNAIRTGGSPRLDLPRPGTHGEIGDRHVLRFTAAMGHDVVHAV